MEIVGDLNYSFEEQCFVQLARLKEELSSIEIDKRPTKHRLFKENIFEYVEPRKVKRLENILCYTIRSLGEQIKRNLEKEARNRRPTSASTPTPIRDLPTPSPSIPSPRRSPNNIPSIVISSDEDDDEECMFIKREPPISVSYSQLVADHDEENAPQIDHGFCVVDRTNLKKNVFHDKNGVVHLKSKSQIKFKETSITRQALILHLASQVLKMLGTDVYMSKRELYYKSLDFCRIRKRRIAQSQSQMTSTCHTQSQMPLASTQALSQPIGAQSGSQNRGLAKHGTSKLEHALDDLCCLLGCSRVHLHVLSQAKSLLYGNLKITLKNGEVFNCINKKDGTIIPTGQVPIMKLESDAKFVLVVEKDSVFQKILNLEETYHFVENYRVILFTAKGYPDVSSRAFINFLWSKLKVPILALSDADPHGIEIVCCFKFGCYTTAYESHSVATPQIRWLGLLPSDMSKLSIPESKTLPLTQIDIKKIISLLDRQYIRDREPWNHQLNLMLSTGRKAELESLDSNVEYLVKTYLPNKLRYAAWL